MVPNGSPYQLLLGTSHQALRHILVLLSVPLPHSLIFSHSTLSLSFSLSFRLSHCLSAFVFGNCVKYQSRFASHVKLMKLQRDLRHGTTVKGGREGETEVYWRRGGKGNGDDTSLARWCHKAMRTQQVIHKCN